MAGSVLLHLQVKLLRQLRQLALAFIQVPSEIKAPVHQEDRGLCLRPRGAPCRFLIAVALA
jgi:hypothetical protein